MPGSEDAYASIAVLGREQDDGLGQIYLPGQALQLVVAERRPFFAHRRWCPRSDVSVNTSTIT
jgi:hypothetical protein